METEKIENMLSQLIKMVGTMHSEQNEMKITMHSELKEMKSNMQAAEDKNGTRHKEIMDHLKALENDQDFIWEKSVRNERELANIKRQLS